MAGTYVVPHAVVSVADPEGLAEAQAAMAEGMRLFDERQAPAYDPMGGAELREWPSASQPDLANDPGEVPAESYPQVGPGGVT